MADQRISLSEAARRSGVSESALKRWAADRVTLRARRAASMMLRAAAETRLARAAPQRIATARDRRLREVLAYAERWVPHYRETWGEAGLSAADVSGLADLGRLPLVTREQVAGDPERFRSLRPPPGRSVELRTSGSTGSPVVVFHDQAAGMRTAAPRLRWDGAVRSVAGRWLRRRWMVIANLDSVSLRRRELFRSGLRLPRAEPVMASNFDSPAANAELINGVRPDVLKGFGSHIEAIFEYAERLGMEIHRPGLVVYSADAMSDAGRELISGRYGIPVLGYYGAAEAAHIGFECEAHRGYHLNDDFFPIRILGEDGAEVAAGEEGEVVISNLLLRDTVLINYRLGDRARRLEGPCPCGRTLPMIGFIEGRVDEWLAGPDGELVHPEVLRTLLRGEAGVGRYQFRQRSLERIELHLIGTPPDPEGLRRRLEAGARERIGGPVSLSVELVSELPRTVSGKTRGVVSDLTGSRVAAAARGGGAAIS